MAAPSPSVERLPGWLQAWLGAWGFAAAFLWGFAEATLFFVVPDVGFTLTTALRPRRGLTQLAAGIAGAFLGGSVMYAWALARPAEAQRAVAGLPFVGERMLEETYQRMESRGARALFDRPLGGVPYKVYAVLAPSHLPAARFLGLSVAARAERFLLAWAVFALVAAALRRAGAARWKVAVGIHAVFWLGVYAAYWGAI